MKERNFGRPKIKNPKNKSLTIRLTQEQMNQFEGYSLKIGLSKTEIIRDYIKKVSHEEEII